MILFQRNCHVSHKCGYRACIFEIGVPDKVNANLVRLGVVVGVVAQASEQGQNSEQISELKQDIFRSVAQTNPPAPTAELMPLGGKPQAK